MNMSEWKPIKTAPKDGSQFLAYSEQTGDIGICSRHDPGGEARNPRHHYEAWLVDYDHPDAKPTHWMPLPPPPPEPQAD